MATINLGAIKFNWKGAYNNGTTYAVDDVVSSGGNSYVCIQASTGNAVGNATAYWNIMSSAGTNGTNGTDIASTLTTQGDILYRDGSGLQRLAKGTAGQVLQMNSGATAPEYATASSGGLVGYATAKQPNTTYLNTTSFASLGLTLNYTPVDGANNKIIVCLNGGYGQDDGSDGTNSVTKIRETSVGYDVMSELTGADLAGGEVKNTISVQAEDTNANNNNQRTYQWQGKTLNSASDYRPFNYTTLTVMEIGV